VRRCGRPQSKHKRRPRQRPEFRVTCSRRSPFPGGQVTAWEPHPANEEVVHILPETSPVRIPTGLVPLTASRHTVHRRSLSRSRSLRTVSLREALPDRLASERHHGMAQRETAIRRTRHVPFQSVAIVSSWQDWGASRPVLPLPARLGSRPPSLPSTRRALRPDSPGLIPVWLGRWSARGPLSAPAATAWTLYREGAAVAAGRPLSVSLRARHQWQPSRLVALRGLSR
jgi:hypothetical protein